MAKSADELTLEMIKDLQRNLLNVELLWNRLKTVENGIIDLGERVEVLQNRLYQVRHQIKTSTIPTESVNTPMSIARAEEIAKSWQTHSAPKSSVPQQAQQTTTQPS